MLAVAGLLALLALWAGAAWGQQPACGERARIVAGLQTEFGETPIAIGLANNGAVIEVLASPGGKTWTLIGTAPSGVTCLLSAGENWETRAAARGRRS